MHPQFTFYGISIYDRIEVEVPSENVRKSEIEKAINSIDMFQYDGRHKISIRCISRDIWCISMDVCGPTVNWKVPIQGKWEIYERDTHFT